MKKNFKDRDDVFKSIRTNLLKIGLEEMKKRVAIKFFDMDDIVEVLYRAFVSGKNVILWGPGGFGKSEVVLEFLEQAKLPHSTIIGYQDMDVEGLMGLPNMSKLLEESTYEVAFEKTVFMNPGILILEEFLDVNPKTAIALKDVITSKGYRNGDTFVESKISSMVICSNTSPYEMSTNRSTAAFYVERFPIVYHTVWKDFSSSRYLAFIKKIVGDKEYKAYKQKWEVLAELSARACEENNPISPRIVKDAVEVMQYNDYELISLTYVDGIDTSILDDVILVCKLRDEKSRVMETVTNVKAFIQELLSEENPSSRFVMDAITQLNYVYSKLNILVIEDEYSLIAITELMGSCKQAIELMWDKINSGWVESSSEIDELFLI